MKHLFSRKIAIFVFFMALVSVVAIKAYAEKTEVKVLNLNTIALSNVDETSSEGDKEDFLPSRFGSLPHFDSDFLNKKNDFIKKKMPSSVRSDLKALGELGRGVQEVSLITSDLGFFPKMIFLTRDIPVKLYVTSTSKHVLCIMIDFFDVRKQVRSEKMEEINFTPSVAGAIRFYCPINGIEGLFYVKDPVTDLGKDGIT